MKTQTETTNEYGTSTKTAERRATRANKVREADTIAAALDILRKRMLKTEMLNSAEAATDYLRLLVNCEVEQFYVLSLNSRLRVIGADLISTGTVKDAYVHPRAVAEAVLARGASAVILSHNHPSGHLVPSQADHNLTQQLCTVLNGMDINVMDHIIVTYDASYSFAEMGVMPSK